MGAGRVSRSRSLGDGGSQHSVLLFKAEIDWLDIVPCALLFHLEHGVFERRGLLGRLAV